MTEFTYHFDNAMEAQELAGKYPDVLNRIETAFSVQLTARDTWLRMAGDDENVTRTCKFFDALREARNKGAALRDQGINYALDAFVEKQESKLQRLYACRINVSSNKPPIFAKTFGQRSYIDLIAEKDITFGIGPAGTGKTYLAMAMAVSTLLCGDVSRIILTRPAIEAGEALGFLPGDMQQKVYPYLRPLYDALYDMMSPEDIERNIERGIIEVAPLAYMRGRTLNHAFVVLDEAQNTTTEQMLMFLTRLGFDSKCVITGDLTQVDLPGNKTSGLVEARSTLKNIQDIGFTFLKDADVVRHELVQKVIKAYRDQRQAKEQEAKSEKTNDSPQKAPVTA